MDFVSYVKSETKNPKKTDELILSSGLCVIDLSFYFYRARLRIQLARKWEPGFFPWRGGKWQRRVLPLLHQEPIVWDRVPRR